MVRHLLRGLLVSLSCAAAAAATDRSSSRVYTKPLVLTAAMVGECAASDSALDLARRESARVWSDAGVSIRWVTASDVPYHAPPSEWLVVRCADKAAATAVAPEGRVVVPIAAIRFVSAQPTNTIMVSIENATTLLMRDAPPGAGARTPMIALRDTRLGRMLGRAIAHEVGHFLSRSGAHTPSGLMRASHTVPALTGASLRPFRAPDLFQY
jgi:hypothetical protein